MSEETKAAEPTDQEAREYALGHFESISFLSAHLNDPKIMVRNTANAEKFAAYIRTHRLPWTQESLEKAFRVLRDGGELEMEPNSAEYPELQTPPVDPTPEASYPWGPALTKESLKKITGEQMRRFRNSRNPHSAEFNNQLSALGVQV
jgi:hypothetical protein